MIKLYIQTAEPDPYTYILNDLAGKPFEFTTNKNDYDYIYGLNIMRRLKVIEMCWERLPTLNKEELWNAINVFCSEDKATRNIGLNLIIYSNCKNYKFLYKFLFNWSKCYNNISSLMQDLDSCLTYIDYNWTEIEWTYFKYLWNKCDFKTLK